MTFKRVGKVPVEKERLINFSGFESYLNTSLARKTCFLVGDLNLYLIDYQPNAKVRDLIIQNKIIQHSLVPIVNKPTRVTKNNATLDDYIIANSFTDQENLTGILNTEISDHFPIFTISMKHRIKKESNNCRLNSRI